MRKVQMGFGLSKYPKEPSYGSAGYFALLDREHDAQERAFEQDGWQTLDCCYPFYHHPWVDMPDGLVRTVGSTPTGRQTGPGYDWWWKVGEVPLPAECQGGLRSVVRTLKGKWITDPDPED